MKGRKEMILYRNPTGGSFASNCDLTNIPLYIFYSYHSYDSLPPGTTCTQISETCSVKKVFQCFYDQSVESAGVAFVKGSKGANVRN